MLEKLLLKSVTKVENNFVSVGFDGKCEEIDLKVNIIFSKVLKSQSELSAKNENLDCLVWCQEFLMGLHELDNVVVWEDDLSIAKLVLSLVHYQN